MAEENKYQRRIEGCVHKSDTLNCILVADKDC